MEKGLSFISGFGLAEWLMALLFKLSNVICLKTECLVSNVPLLQHKEKLSAVLSSKHILSTVLLISYANHGIKFLMISTQVGRDLQPAVQIIERENKPDKNSCV